MIAHLDTNIYKNPNIYKIVDSIIEEWDIKAAALMALKFIDINIYNQLKDKPKLERNICIGKLIKKDKTLHRKIYVDHILNWINEFLKINYIEQENIVESTMDSVTLVKSPIKINKLANSVYFRKKEGRFTSYYKLPKVVLQYDFCRKKCTYKGIKNDAFLNTYFYKNYLNLLFDELELNYKNKKIYAILSKYRKLYFNHNNRDIYRSVFKDNNFVYRNKNIVYTLFEYDEDYGKLDISDNYMNLILPLMKLFI